VIRRSIMTNSIGAAGCAALLVAALVTATSLAPPPAFADQASETVARAAPAAQCGPVPIRRPSKLCTGKIGLKRAIPADMAENPVQYSDGFGSRWVDCFAWESFVALNWPAQKQCRGTPSTKNRKKSLKDWTSNRVWETYTEPYELFQVGDDDWNPKKLSFDDKRDIGECGGEEIEKNILRRNSSSFQLFYEDSQAFLDTSILTDQRGNTVWYEVLFNRDQYDYIQKNGLAKTGAYTYSGPLDSDIVVDFPTQTSGTSGAGSIEIKAAWRLMTDDDKLNRYFTQTAITFDGENCDEVTVGLVGLHIARKVDSSPKWVWATFEHVDNVPPADSKGDGRDYNFFSKQCYKDAPANCSRQVAIIDIDNVCCPNLLPDPEPGFEINQVTRLVPIDASNDMGRKFKKAYKKAGSPFRHFRLIGAQWAKPNTAGSGAAIEISTGEAGSFAHPVAALAKAYDRPCNPSGPWSVPAPHAGQPCYDQVPPVLRNTSMETMNVQTDAEGVQRSVDSCMNCHWAGGVDGSYIWLDAMLNSYDLSE